MSELARVSVAVEASGVSVGCELFHVAADTTSNLDSDTIDVFSYFSYAVLPSVMFSNRFAWYEFIS